MKDSFRKSGYDLEEFYFQKLNQELIEKLQAKKKVELKLVVDNTSVDRTSEKSQNPAQTEIQERKKAA